MTSLLSPVVLALCCVLAILLVELALRLPFRQAVGGMLSIMGKSGRLLNRRNVSDHWKEKALLRYSAGTLKWALILLASLAVLCVACLGLAMLADLAVPGFVGILFSGAGFAGLFGLSLLHLFLRERLRRV